MKLVYVELDPSHGVTKNKNHKCITYSEEMHLLSLYIHQIHALVIRIYICIYIHIYVHISAPS